MALAALACASSLVACSADQGPGTSPDARGDTAPGDGAGGSIDAGLDGAMPPMDSGAGNDGTGGGFDSQIAGETSIDPDASTGPEGGTTPGDGGGTPGDAAGPGDGGTMGCGPMELCTDGLDNDCDGVIDENCVCEPGMATSCFVGAPGIAGVGACIRGTQRCLGSGEFGTWGPCMGSGSPTAEVCDGRDNDCDGMVDNMPARSCYSGPEGTRGVGICAPGSQRCEDGVWSTCTGSVLPLTEVCDGRDNDCNGMVDDLPPRSCFSGPAGTMPVGACRAGTQTCSGGIWEACTGSVLPMTEVCDGVDNDCDGTTDEGCACRLGDTRACGSTVGACRAGTESCSALGTWGMCTGATGPSTEVCDGADNDCDGETDEGLASACYPGPARTQNVGACRGGMQRCVGGRMTGCEGAVVPVTEVCDNRIDDDCDGETDEGCEPCITGTASSSGWEMHRVQGPVCFGRRFERHGDVGEYELAMVPTASDPAWRPVTSSTIDFAESSALCGRSCTCLDGGEFTFFQTFFDVTPGYRVSSLAISMESVDDGARVTVFNSMYPAGVTDPGSYIFIGGTTTTTDLARYIVPGRNRVLITHIDDCCSARTLAGVRVVLNGGPLHVCP